MWILGWLRNVEAIMGNHCTALRRGLRIGRKARDGTQTRLLEGSRVWNFLKQQAQRGKRESTVAGVGTATRSPICNSAGALPAFAGALWKMAIGVPSAVYFLSR